MKTSIILVAMLVSQMAIASTPAKQKVDLKKDFNSLGDNQAVVQKANSLDPKNNYQVVQSRAVDRNLRIEIGINYGLIGGGDSYYRTQNLGANLDFHITPHWSLGVRYYHSYNDLTPEGESVFNHARGNNNNGDTFGTVGVDYPIDTTLAVLNFYPLYGKLNVFDMGVTHFDIYPQVGYGKVNLSSGQADVFAAGGGIGFWWTQHFNSRLEARYETYTDHPNFDAAGSSTRKISEVVGMLSAGFML